MDDILSQLKPLLLKIGLAAVALGILLILFRHLRQWHCPMHDRGIRRRIDDILAADAQEQQEQEGAIPLASPRSTVRKWKVSGVEKANGNDATWFVDAESRANAKVKAELKGMIVTAVERAAQEH